MAIKVTKIFQRTDTNTAWYRQSDETATHFATEYEGQGVRTYITTPDEYTFTVTRFFVDQARYEQFITDSVMIVERIARANYNLENNIDESPALSEEVPFDFNQPMITMTKTFTRPSEAVEFYKMDEETLTHYRSIYINEARALTPLRVLSEDKLSLNVIQKFTTQADHDAFMADPVIIASANARTAYNTANGITESPVVVS